MPELEDLQTPAPAPSPVETPAPAPHLTMDQVDALTPAPTPVAKPGHLTVDELNGLGRSSSSTSELGGGISANRITKSVSCPKVCKSPHVSAGGKWNGGLPLENGLCTHWSSRAFQHNATYAMRYCGPKNVSHSNSTSYTADDAVNCEGCKALGLAHESSRAKGNAAPGAERPLPPQVVRVRHPMVGPICVPASCRCRNGAPRVGCTHPQEEQCLGCNPGFVRKTVGGNSICVPLDSCRCVNGAPRRGMACEAALSTPELEEHCASCKVGGRKISGENDFGPELEEHCASCKVGGSDENDFGPELGSIVRPAR